MMEGISTLDYDDIHGPQYVDLLTAHEDDNADAFFDTVEEMEGSIGISNEGIPIDISDSQIQISGEEVNTPKRSTEKRACSLRKSRSFAGGHTNQSLRQRSSSTKTDVHEDQNSSKTSKVDESPYTRVLRSSKTPKISDDTPQTRGLRRSQSARRSKASENQKASSVEQKEMAIKRPQTPVLRSAAKRSHDGHGSEKRIAAPSEAKTSSLLNAPKLKRKLPETHAVKSSEEQELEKIANFRQELAKKRKLNQKSCEAALKGKMPVCPVQHHVTIPTEFKFESDSRIKSNTKDAKQESPKDFVRTLRSDIANQAHTTSKNCLTKPKPFNLTETKKRKLPDLTEVQAKKYQSMAEQLAKFTKTPERFRSKSRTGKYSDQKPGNSKPHGVTIPKTPQFETRTRHRTVTAPSKEELEEKEIEEMQRHQFKAHPVNHKILKDGSIGIKKVPAKAPTVPEEFHLTAAKSHHMRHQSEDHYEFHAQPVNTRILEGTVGVKEVEKLPPTVPESPAFTLKHRVRMPLQEVPKVEKPNPRHRHAPHHGLPFQPQIEHKKTEPVPFAFEERDRKRAEEKKKKIACALEEEKKHREFHANPLPDLTPSLPPKKTKAPTKLQPFALETNQRGVKKTEEWNRKMHDEIEQQTEKTTFKAREATVLEHEPFIPQKENRHTTEISEFEFNTAKRVAKREAFEHHRKVKQVEMDDIRVQMQRMKEDEERAELERMRKETVHKANPIKRFKSVNIKLGEKPLTAPRSPRFQTDTRLRTRMMHEHSHSNMSH